MGQGFFKGGANSNAWPLRHDEGRVQEGDVPPPVLCAEIFAEGCLREPIDLVCSQSLMNVLVHHFHDIMNIINLEGGGGGGGSSPLSPPLYPTLWGVESIGCIQLYLSSKTCSVTVSISVK